MNTPSRGEAFRVWLKIGLLSFGGPAAQIALMHRMIVSEKGWLSEKQYLSALGFCMLLPGPEAMQLATYAGWKLQGTRGGLVAGLLFVLPGALVVLALASAYAYYGNIGMIAGLFLGIKAAVIIIVVEALLRVAKKALSQRAHWLIAGLAFVAIFFLNLPFPLIIALAALYGYFFAATQTQKPAVSMADTAIARPSAQQFKKTLSTVLIWLFVWSLPFILLWLVNADALLLELGSFFSRLAVVTFGGAYAVLSYLAQDIVVNFGWLTAGEMMDGLGLAETTPGPLILVTEFAGFMAGFHHAGLPMALAAAMVTLWVTFVPCFLWIFAGAPYIDWLSDQPKLKQAMSAITAAVVGVILNLSLWFALHVLFREVEAVESAMLTLWSPDWASLDWRVAIMTALCGLYVFVWHWPVTRVLAVSAVTGLALSVFPVAV